MRTISIISIKQLQAYFVINVEKDAGREVCSTSNIVVRSDHSVLEFVQ